MTWKRFVVVVLLLLPVAAYADLVTETSIPNVTKDTQAEVTGRFGALVENQKVDLSATLRVDGSSKGAIACNFKETSTKGEYAFTVPIDFSKYVGSGATVDATVTIKSTLDGEFKDLKVSIKSPRDK